MRFKHYFIICILTAIALFAVILFTTFNRSLPFTPAYETRLILRECTVLIHNNASQIFAAHVRDSKNHLIKGEDGFVKYSAVLVNPGQYKSLGHYPAGVYKIFISYGELKWIYPSLELTSQICGQCMQPGGKDGMVYMLTIYDEDLL